MAHNHEIVDSDTFFEIDPVTRNISSESENLTLCQSDHNSERYTFELPQFVEGHDMSTCDRITIHYDNMTKTKKQKSSDVYIVTDAKTEDGKTIFSWLIARNATKYVGTLQFSIEFSCFDDDNIETYSWHTNKFTNIKVTEVIDNEQQMVEELPDALHTVKQEIIEALPPGPVGPSGYTPVKGVDYFTEEDMSTLVGKKTEDGGEIFGDYDTNIAQGDFSAAFGKETISGCKGYYLRSIDLENKKIYLSDTQQVPVISTANNAVSLFVTPEYSAGDYFCIINDNHYVYKATIKAVYNNVVEYDGDLGFTKINGTSYKDPHDYSFFVPTRPLVGIAILTTRTVSLGYNTICSGRDGIAAGNGCIVVANGGISLGSKCVAGYIAFAFGFGNKSLGTRSASFGSNNESLGNNSFTTGENNIASGVRSYSEGYNNQSQGENAHSEGYNTKAIGGSSHTEGHTTEAKYCAHAEGHTTKAHGNYTHTEGQETEALKAWAHAQGYKTIADAYAAHVEGYGTKVTTDYAHVQGKWNELDTEKKYVHIVGWGTSDEARKNIHTLDKNGNAWYEGDVVGNGISLATVNSNANTAKTNASSALTKATNAESTANTANTKASNAEKKVTALEEYSGIIDIPYFDKIQPTDKAIYRVPHNYLALDGKFYDYAAVHTVEDYTQFTMPVTQIVKDSQGNDKVQYSICYDVNQKQYYCYYNNVHCILGSDAVRSQVFNGRTYVGAVTNPEDAKENTYGVFKVFTLYMYVENVGYVRLNTDKTKGYFAERFNSPDNKPTGSFSTSLGIRTKAPGYAALSGGDSSEANGAESIAIGAACVANKYASSATCNHTIANGKGQSARGEYNEPLGDDYLEVVGNGTSIGARSNAYTLDKKGNAWFAGSVEAPELILKSPNGTRFRITVADDGSLSSEAIQE